jgi:spermidine/putrescine transport system ATP-binding protein
MLDVIRLRKFADRRPAQLSGGQQQRVALARALVNYPRALLLDEPLGALDLKLRQAMQIELKRIQRDVGIAFIYVTHDQEEALTMSDRIAVMNEGRVEQIAPPREIYDAPESLFVATFIGVANLLPATVAATAGDRITVRSCGRELPVPKGTHTFANGAAAMLVVRPERLELSAEEPAVPTAIRAELTNAVFQGPVVRCLLRTAEGTEIVCHVEADDEQIGLEPGRQIWLRWDVDAARLLPAEATKAA